MSANTIRAINDVSELRRIAYEANIPLPNISQCTNVFQIRDLFFSYLSAVLSVKTSPRVWEEVR